MNALFFAWLIAQLQPTPTPNPSPPDDLSKQFEQSVAADKAQVAATGTQAATTPIRSQALLNPAMSVIGTFSGAWRRKDAPPQFSAGDDPAPQGITAQELEFAFSSDVDPYFKMRVFLTIPQLEGIEVEEAYLLTTHLPANLLLKAGVFRSSFGRNNEQHLHMQDFARRPFITAYVGDDGLRAPGAQLSVLIPLPWYTTLAAEVFSLSPGEFGDQISGTLVLEQFFEMSDSWSLLLGLDLASLNPGPAEDAIDPTDPAADPEREWVGGFDVYLKWKPANVVNSYSWVAFTAEGIGRKTAGGSGLSDMRAGVYGQLVAQVSRRWRVGVRGEYVGFPQVVELSKQWIASASLGFLPSEFSRLRLTYSHEHDPADSSFNNDTVILQLEAAIGAHGAHPF